MRRLAADHVCGLRSLEEVADDLWRHYEGVQMREQTEARAEEADKVSLGIVEILEEGSFSLDPMQLSAIHAHLFSGIDDERYRPGAFRREDVFKCEEILCGDSVLYGSPRLFIRSLEMLFARELDRDYVSGAGLTKADLRSLARFVANVWMVHPFVEGNTRTVAVFMVLYLCLLGFTVDLGPLASHARFLRGALVRACYQNRSVGVTLDATFVEAFIRSLVGDKTVPIDSRDLWCTPLFAHPERLRHVSLAEAAPVQRNLVEQGVTARLLRCEGSG